jgi:hypothetical protein
MERYGCENNRGKRNTIGTNNPRGILDGTGRRSLITPFLQQIFEGMKAALIQLIATSPSANQSQIFLGGNLE